MYKKLKLTTISELIKNIYCSLSVIIIGCASAYAVEFNKDLIEAEDRENVNLSQFETDGQLPVGKYSLSTLINNKRTPIHLDLQWVLIDGFAPIFPDICYHLTHYKPAAADIPVASDNPAHYADAIRYNARTPLQGSLLPLTRLVWA